jgi:small subunit ribosomal protein S6
MSAELFKKTVEKYETVLLADGGQLIKKDDWGVRKLAYPMKKQFRGRYVLYDLTCKPEHLKESERLMRIDENVLRYLNILIGENVDVEARKIELAKAEAKALAGQNASL